MEERRQKARLVLMYKIVNGLVKTDVTDRFTQPSRVFTTESKHGTTLLSDTSMYKCNTIIRKESFYPRTIRDWNDLTTDTATAKSHATLKAYLLD